MANFKFKKWGSSYKPYKKGNSINKRSNGNFKAAKAQADNANIVVKGTLITNALYKSEYDANPVYIGEDKCYVKNVGTSFINFYNVLNKNKNFILQKQLWDEFRINKIRVKMTVADAATTAASFNEIKTIQVITAWDRTGLSCRQITALDKVPEGEGDNGLRKENIIDPLTEKRTKNVKMFYTKLGPIIEEYGSKYKTPLNSFQNFKRSCNLSVRDGAEKNSWISTEVIDDPGFTYNAINCSYTCDAKNQKTLEDFENDSNPANPIENPTNKWKPTLLISVYRSGISGNQLVEAVDTDNVIFNVSYEMDIVFRGPRTIA